MSRAHNSGRTQIPTAVVLQSSRGQIPRSSSPFPPPTTPPSPRKSSDVQQPSMSKMSNLSLSSKNVYPKVAEYATRTTKNYHPTSTFGVPLEFVTKEGYIPMVVEQTIQYLEQNALQEEGILRLAGSSSEIKELKQTYDNGQVPNFNSLTDVQSVAGLLKLFFRELPSRLLVMTSGLRAAMEDVEDDDVRCEMIRTDFQNIPEVNYYTMQRLFGFLNTVTSYSSKNKMSASNLAIVFHPTLQIRMDLLELLISRYNDIFY